MSQSQSLSYTPLPGPLAPEAGGANPRPILRGGETSALTGRLSPASPRMHCYEFSTLLQAKRRQLLEMVREQIAEAGGRKSAALALHDPVGGPNVSDHEMVMVIRRSHELREIEVALDRIADGSYGLCADCGGEIDRMLLKAEPTAIRCPLCRTRVLPGLLLSEQ